MAETLYERMTKSIERGVENVLRLLIFWEKDDKRIGRAIRFIHYSFVFLFIAFYLFIHVYHPSYALLLIFFFIQLLIFAHHIICGGCVITNIECRLIGDQQCFIDPLLQLFHIPTTPDVSSPVFIMLSVLLMAILSLEVWSRTVLMWQQWFS
jgi:hypothetical protein